MLEKPMNMDTPSDKAELSWERKNKVTLGI
jgi:hypothetical protein